MQKVSEYFLTLDKTPTHQVVTTKLNRGGSLIAVQKNGDGCAEKDAFDAATAASPAVWIAT